MIVAVGQRSVPQLWTRVLAVLFAFGAYQGVTAEVGRACEHERLTITCDEGETILVLEANYGRTSSSVCTQGPRITDIDCFAESTMPTMSQACTGRRSCTVRASNSVFGDPCVGTYKYLEVVYSCLGMTTEQMTTAKKDLQGFCEEETIETETGRVVFLRTEGGSFAYSEENCTSSSGFEKPLASRFCRLTTDRGAEWDPPVFLACDISLRNLSQTPVMSPEVALAVATELQVITTETETLSSDDVTIVSVIIEELANASPTEEIGDSLLTTIDNLMHVDAAALMQSQQERKGPTRVVQALETFADTVALTTETYTSMRPSVVLQAADISLEELDKGQGFAFSLSGNDSSSLAEGSVSSFTAEDGGGNPHTADISITLPTNLSNILQINDSAAVRVSYTLYNDSSLFVQPSQGAVGTRIIGGRIAGQQIKNLSQPVVLTFAPLGDFSPEEIKEVRCVYWDFEADAGQGAWSNEGCLNTTEENGRFTCNFNHLTNFAVIFDVHGSGFGVHEDPLTVITIVGCVVSIIGLVLTLLSFFFTMKHSRRIVGAHAKNQRHVLINLCVALLAILITFLAGINQTASAIGCTVVAALLHYFLLAALIWMAMEAVNIYTATVKVFDHYVTRNFILKAAAIAWGFPLIIMLCTAGPSSLYEYRKSAYCWLAHIPLTYAFLIPAGLILLFNMVVFSIIMYNLMKRENKQKKLTAAKKNEGDHQWIIRQLRRAFSVMVLFGLTWVFGFFVIDGARTVFAYLFCIFNTLQGIFIFIFHCVMREDVKKWRKETFSGRETTKKNQYVVNRSTSSNKQTSSSSVVQTPQGISFNPSPSVSKA